MADKFQKYDPSDDDVITAELAVDSDASATEYFRDREQNAGHLRSKGRADDQATEYVRGDDQATEYVRGDDQATEYVRGDDQATEYVRGDDQATEYVRGDDQATEYIGAKVSTPKPAARAESGKAFCRCLHCFEPLENRGQKVCPLCGYAQGKEPEVNYHLPPGTLLTERYVIGDVEGFGGFGITYRAWDLKLDRMVAIKEYFNANLIHRVPGSMQTEPNSRNKTDLLSQEMERFRKEAEYTAEFRDCRGIVEIFDIFSANGTRYIVMEFLHGLTLGHYVKEKGGHLSWEESQKIFVELTEAVERLHSKKIIHRDIAPDNIFICDDGKVKLMDLGAARFADGSENKLKTVILKAGYAPPEQYSGDGNQGPWTDVYAMSATLYRVLTGKKPAESMDRQAGENVEKPSKMVSGIPGYVDKIIFRGMNLTPELRFKNMAELRKALLHGEDIRDSEKELKRRRTVRGVLIAAGLAVVAIAAAVIISSYQSERKEAYLTGAKLSVWVPEETGNAGTEEIYRSITEEFAADYPGVELSFTAIPQSEYAQRVTDALNAGNTEPALYVSSMVGEVPSVSKDELLRVFDYAERSAYPLDPEVCFAGGIPLGFRCIVAYGNTTADRNAGVTADRKQFTDRKALLYPGDSSEYYTIQTEMPGIYQVLDRNTDTDTVCGTDCWNVNGNLDKNAKNAAIRLLSYWLGEQAQEILHVSNQRALPVNSNMLDIYLEVNREMSDAGICEGTLRTVDDETFEQERKGIASDQAACALLAEQIGTGEN